MPDFKKMTVERLRELARKILGPGHSRLRKGELVRALEEAGEGAPPVPARGSGTRARGAGGRAAAAAGKAVRAAKDAGKAAREGARAVARAGKAAAGAGTKAVRERRGAKAGEAGAPGRTEELAAQAAGAPAGDAPVARRGHGRAEKGAEGLPDPEGYFVARVRGEDAVRDAPHPMAEAGADEPYAGYAEGVGGPLFEEHLGELPWEYGDDAFTALPRDPRTLFFYWDHARDTVARGFEGLDRGRVQLWIFARTAVGWERIRTLDFALESRSYYVHDLEPGRTYRAEIHAVDRQGRERLVGAPSNEVTLPRVGPSPVIDDRFTRIPWDVALGALLGPGHPGAPFPEEARALLARLSDWSRFSGKTWGGSAGGIGGRPSSPTSSPSSPFGAWGEGDAR